MTHDLIIIGGGPAGLAAGIYAMRYRINHTILTQDVGGTANDAHLVENYPGFYQISGMELMGKFKEHYEYLGGAVQQEAVRSITPHKEGFSVSTPDETYEAKTVLLSGGTKRRTLDVPGEKEFSGRGVSYCATCDAFFFKNKTVAVIGGNDAAAGAAVLLAQHAEKVYIIYRREEIRAEPYWLEQIENNPAIEVINNTNITKIQGNQLVESVELDSGDTLPVNGVFIEIGSVPPKQLIDEIGLETDQRGRIQVDAGQKTSMDGMYAAGDITTGSNGIQQIVTAASEGTIAIMSLFKEIKRRS